MADRNDIITLPDERLRTKSLKIKAVDEAIQKIIQDMQDATLDWEDHREHEFGVALAAVQIGEMYKIVVVRNNMEDKNDRSFVVMINPKIVSKSGGLITDYEGCLSVKDIYGKVPRYKKVKVVAQDVDGREFRITAEGFLARVMQHEIDHTNGIVFIDHIKDASDAFYMIDDDGKLKALDYDSNIKNSDILW
jgi:peptide deformylase